MAVDGTNEQEKHALFVQWALPHKDAIYTACCYLTRQREEAEDLFQETFLRAFRFFHQFTLGTNCRAWLLTIMRNAFRNRYAQRQREARSVEFDDAEREYERQLLRDGTAHVSDPEELVFAQMVDQEITDALRSLPEEYRSTFLLIDVEDLTYEEAATILQCPIGTVRSRLSRARRLLQAILTNYAVERGYIEKENDPAIPTKLRTE